MSRIGSKSTSIFYRASMYRLDMRDFRDRLLWSPSALHFITQWIVLLIGPYRLGTLE
jgi:hypothetical protein